MHMHCLHLTRSGLYTLTHSGKGNSLAYLLTYYLLTTYLLLTYLLTYLLTTYLLLTYLLTYSLRYNKYWLYVLDKLTFETPGCTAKRVDASIVDDAETDEERDDAPMGEAASSASPIYGGLPAEAVSSDSPIYGGNLLIPASPIF